MSIRPLPWLLSPPRQTVGHSPGPLRRPTSATSAAVLRLAPALHQGSRHSTQGTISFSALSSIAWRGDADLRRSRLVASPRALHGRYDYSPIHLRPAATWPGGKALAVYVAINVECFVSPAGLGPSLQPFLEPPNSEHQKTAWRDYGLRVGFWRLLDLLDEYRLPPCHLLNAYVCDFFPEIADAIRARGEEVVAHGRTNAEAQGGLWEAQELALIRESTDRLEDAFGTRPLGWMTPCASLSRVTWIS